VLEIYRDFLCGHVLQEKSADFDLTTQSPVTGRRVDQGSLCVSIQTDSAERALYHMAHFAEGLL